MRSLIKNIQEKIDARVLRERIWIFLSALSLLFIVWNFLIQTPVENKKKDIESRFNALVAQRTAAQQQIAELDKAMMNDPDRAKEEQAKQLQADINEVDAKLQNASQGLVKADQLPQVLEDVLVKTSKLTLLEVATLPVHELQVETVTGDLYKLNDRGSKKIQDRRNIGVFEHVVQLRVSGSYFQVVQFLAALESLQWRFYWQRLDYQVTQYPNAEVILRVYTLSSEEGLLGV